MRRENDVILRDTMGITLKGPWRWSSPIALGVTWLVLFSFAHALSASTVSIITYTASYNMRMNYTSLNGTFTITFNGEGKELLKAVSNGITTEYTLTRNGDAWTITLTLAKRELYSNSSLTVEALRGVMVTLTTRAAGLPLFGSHYYFRPYTDPSANPDIALSGINSLSVTASFTLTLQRSTLSGNGFIEASGLRYGSTTLIGTLSFVADTITNFVTSALGTTSSEIHGMVTKGLGSFVKIFEEVIDGVKTLVNYIIDGVTSFKPELARHLGFLEHRPRVLLSTWALGLNRNGEFKLPVLVVDLTSGDAVLDEVEVIHQGKVLCRFPYFALSADDRGRGGKGLKFYGYFGSSEYRSDKADLKAPGGIIVDVGAGPAAGGATDEIPPHKFFNKPFATVVAGHWMLNHVDYDKVETYFDPTYTYIAFLGQRGSTTPADNSTKVGLFDLVGIGNGEWSLVIWCDKVNINMNEVLVKLYFENGGVVEATVPLTIQ